MKGFYERYENSSIPIPTSILNTSFFPIPILIPTLILLATFILILFFFPASVLIPFPVLIPTSILALLSAAEA